MSITKPPHIAADEFKSSKWDEIIAGREYSQSDVPMITLLCQWYAIAQRCIEDMDEVGCQVAYENKMGDIKELPQISTMKKACDAIRALNKQLGIDDQPKQQPKKTRETPLYVIQTKREERGARAARAG